MKVSGIVPAILGLRTEEDLGLLGGGLTLPSLSKGVSWMETWLGEGQLTRLQ